MLLIFRPLGRLYLDLLTEIWFYMNIPKSALTKIYAKAMNNLAWLFRREIFHVGGALSTFPNSTRLGKYASCVRKHIYMLTCQMDSPIPYAELQKPLKAPCLLLQCIGSLHLSWEV